ncbi:hypothetical protein [Vibrio campbellii]|uniref:hypothetical protein n=1 Tax=Vibrio campbellii TaxID=680 RepID=UPI000CD35F08|nr:hypothetical protein [Vibrio campbellii]AUW07444.1 hypothetical protein C1N51_27705 [Vibrio campbellii]
MANAKSVQIRLREDFPLEKKIIEYLAKIGGRSGLEKQIFVRAMTEHMAENPLDDDIGYAPKNKTKDEKVFKVKPEESKEVVSVEERREPLQEQSSSEGYSSYFGDTQVNPEKVDTQPTPKITPKLTDVASFMYAKG